MNKVLKGLDYSIKTEMTFLKLFLDQKKNKIQNVNRLTGHF